MSEKKKFLLRVDEEIFKSYERWAQDEFRSTNAQMEFVLREALIKASRYREKSGEKDKVEKSSSSNKGNR
jgi:hypothetical protein